MSNKAARLVTATAQTVAIQGITPEFRTRIVAAIRKLEGDKAGTQYAGKKGVHTVFSGLNAELRRIGMDPIATVRNLVELGVIESHPVRGGAMVYIKGEMPEQKGKAFGLLG